jgi:hypothetical protein
MSPPATYCTVDVHTGWRTYSSIHVRNVDQLWLAANGAEIDFGYIHVSYWYRGVFQCCADLLEGIRGVVIEK